MIAGHTDETRRLIRDAYTRIAESHTTPYGVGTSVEVKIGTGHRLVLSPKPDERVLLKPVSN